MSTVIRRATAADPAAIAKVHVASWQQAYRDILPEAYLASLSIEQRLAQWHKTIEAQINPVFVAEVDGEVVGFSCVGPCRDADAGPQDYEILAIYLDNRYWSKDLGRQLWLAARDVAVVQGAQRMSLWVFSKNLRAIKFYQTMGFSCETGSLEVFDIGCIEASELRFSMRLR